MVENVPTILLQIMIRVLMQTPNSKLFFGYHFDKFEIINTYNPLEKGYNSQNFNLKYMETGI